MDDNQHGKLLTRIGNLFDAWLKSAEPVSNFNIRHKFQSCFRFWKQQVLGAHGELLLDLFAGNLLLNGYRLGALRLRSAYGWMPVELDASATLNGVGLVMWDSSQDPDELRSLVNDPDLLYVLTLTSSIHLEPWLSPYSKVRPVAMNLLEQTYAYVSIVELMYRSEWDLYAGPEDKRLLIELLEADGIVWKRAAALRDRWVELRNLAT